MQAAALAALSWVGNAKERIIIVPQVIVEFWTVATRPVANNGLGLTPQLAEVEVRKILATFELLPETPALFDEWRKLVVAHAVSGVETHDARMVAAMKVHGITHLLTFNEQDFERYKGIITVVTPSKVVSQGAHS
jgi:predicted nucleic acid-binding protein